MEKLLLNNKVYNYYEYPLEKEFEQIIVEKSAQIFGQNSIYIDIKNVLVIVFLQYLMVI